MGRVTRREVLAMPLAALLARAGAGPAPARVWAATDGDKIDRDDLRTLKRDANAAWDGRRVKLFGARNEVLAFQLVVTTGATGVARASAALPELRRRGGGGRIAYAAPGPR